eukprot:m.258764 g.258764  ORF g.258764 m.258764 type:complete len:61 (+) comp37042_c0_seq1:181-363(+)
MIEQTNESPKNEQPTNPTPQNKSFTSNETNSKTGHPNKQTKLLHIQRNSHLTSLLNILLL